jgi:hypothetical protein
MAPNTIARSCEIDKVSARLQAQLSDTLATRQIANLSTMHATATGRSDEIRRSIV